VLLDHSLRLFDVDIAALDADSPSVAATGICASGRWRASIVIAVLLVLEGKRRRNERLHTANSVQRQGGRDARAGARPLTVHAVVLPREP